MLRVILQAWVLLLGLVFGAGLLAALLTGDFRWLALCVVPGAIFGKWWRVS